MTNLEKEIKKRKFLPGISRPVVVNAKTFFKTPKEEKELNLYDENFNKIKNIREYQGKIFLKKDELNEVLKDSNFGFVITLIDAEAGDSIFKDYFEDLITTEALRRIDEEYIEYAFKNIILTIPMEFGE